MTGKILTLHSYGKMVEYIHAGFFICGAYRSSLNDCDSWSRAAVTL